MLPLLDDPEHWRSRAEEARSIAEQLAAPEAKRVMARIAETYLRLAEQAASGTKSNTGRV